MKEVTGNIWDYPARIRCITTNGDINRAGQAVMGRGVALQAAQRWPGIRFTLARALHADGNHTHNLGSFDLGGGTITLFSFPVKHHWHEQADTLLIERSARELFLTIDAMGYEGPVVLPRPGCGNGQLTWEAVKPMLTCLDDRFHVIDLA